MSTPPWQAEIVELHSFFEGWLGGTLPNSDAVYSRLAASMGPEFALVTPGGERLGRAELLAQLRATHGSRPGWRIWIERAELRLAEGGLVLASYEEWQRHADGAVTGRLSTALFREWAAAPHGLDWLHVHETWLPDATQRARR